MEIIENQLEFWHHLNPSAWKNQRVYSFLRYLTESKNIGNAVIDDYSLDSGDVNDKNTSPMELVVTVPLMVEMSTMKTDQQWG